MQPTTCYASKTKNTIAWSQKKLEFADKIKQPHAYYDRHDFLECAEASAPKTSMEEAPRFPQDNRVLVYSSQLTILANCTDPRE